MMFQGDGRMTLTIELNADQENAVCRHAHETGLEPAAFVLSLVEEMILFEAFEPIPSDDAAEYAEAVKGIQRGLDDSSAGRHKPANQVFAEIRARHGIQ